MHFSTPLIEDLLPVVQRRLGLQDPVSHSNQLRLQQDILQEASQRYLQHISSVIMPHLGQPSMAVERNPTREDTIPRADTVPQLVASESDLPTLEVGEALREESHSHGTTESTKTSTDHSSPVLTQMAAIPNSGQGNAPTEGHRRSPVIPPTAPEFAVNDEQDTQSSGEILDFESTLRSFQNLRSEQLRAPLDLPVNFGDIDWDAELDKVMVSA